ncbi:MAG: hypothetical protein ACLQCB_19040 [Spirochaetia bacterium]
MRQPQSIAKSSVDSLKEIVDQSLTRKKPAFPFVNNRLEGNAPETIEAVVAGLVR